MTSALASLLQNGISDLQWKVWLATDFTRIELLSTVRFEDLSAAGRDEAARAGYAAGDSVILQVRAERDGAPEVGIPAKSDAPTIHWITRIRKETPRVAAEGAKAGGCLVGSAAFAFALLAFAWITR